MPPACPASADLITRLEEARLYYTSKLARAHTITVYDHRVTIVFERTAIHLYSKAHDGPASEIPATELVERVLNPRPPPTKESRRFNCDRARLMDQVLPAISSFLVSVPEAGGRHGNEKRVLYGPVLPDGRTMRVVLRPGPGTAWTCVSAYPVSPQEVMDARRLKRAKFPPG